MSWLTLHHQAIYSYLVCRLNRLSDWGLDNMAPIWRMPFANAFFLNEIVWILIQISLKVGPKGLN